MIGHYGYDDFLDRIEEIENYIERYENIESESATLKDEIANLDELRDGLYDKYGKKYGIITGGEGVQYSKEEIEEIRQELADTSLLTLIKRFLGIGGKKEEIYFELMSKIEGLGIYLNETLERTDAEAANIAALLKKAAGDYEALYQEIRSASGCTPDTNWWSYTPVSEVSGDLYLCDVDVPMEVEIHYARQMLQDVMPLTYHNHMICIPYTCSLTDPVHFLYDYKKEYGIQAIQSVKSIVYQMIRMTPDYYMQMHLMDGENTGSDFAELIELQQVREADLIELNRKVTGGSYKLAQLYLSDADITSGLRELDRYMTIVASELGAYESLEAYNQANKDPRTGKGLIPYQTVIVENFPTGFNDDDIVLLDRLIKNGQKRGISVILLNNEDRWLEQTQRNGYGSAVPVSLQDKISDEAMQTLAVIRLESELSHLTAEDCSSTCHLQLMRTGRTDYIRDVIQTKMAIKETDNYYPNVFDTEAPYGQMDATKSLQIPFAIDKQGNVMNYCLGEAMNAHGLISGGTGSGKSTLLHMLISSIVRNYTPQDVEIWLADYKITEFYSYKSNTPPHIGFIGLSKTEDFSYAFLDKITGEMNRRQNVIAMADYELKQKGEQTNITNFREYREAFGTSSMRRLVVIIDEFHVMAQHAQSESEYKQKLENILAEARALGISMLFSDQAIVDGLKGLSDKGKKQIKARIAMSNYEDELKETLNESEREKIKPFLNMKVGEIAVQTVFEDRDEDGALFEGTHIERGLVVYIDGTWRYKISAKAREIYHAQDYVPDSFDDRETVAVSWKDIERWEKNSLPAHRDGTKDLQIYVGRPVNLELSMHFSLLPRKGNNIMSVAGTEEQQMRILQAVAGSFRRQEDYEMVIFTDPYSGVYREFQPEFQAMARDDQRISVYSNLNDICYQINRLLGRFANRGNQKKTMIFWLGLDTIADLLREESSKKPAGLQELAREETQRTAEKRQEEEKSAAQSRAEDLFGSLFGEDDADIPSEEEIVEEIGLEETEEEWLYNASDDIVKLIHLGPVRNMFNMVVYDSAVSIRDFREVKISDFNHKIAFVMSDNEASDFLERSNLIRTMSENMAFYYNGRTGRKFIPYKL